MNKIFEFLNGKKTVIGSAFLIASAFLTQVVIGMWDAQSPLVDNLIETFDWIGMVLGGIGLSHKGIKAMKPK